MERRVILVTIQVFFRFLLIITHFLQFSCQYPKFPWDFHSHSKSHSGPRDLLNFGEISANISEVSKVKYTDIAKFAGHLPHRYGNSRAIWDHTVLPATRQRWHSRLYPSRSWYSIKRPRRDAKLSWPIVGWLQPEMVYPPEDGPPSQL